MTELVQMTLISIVLWGIYCVTWVLTSIWVERGDDE